MNWAAEQLNIKEPNDWYKAIGQVRENSRKNIDFKDLVNIGGGSLLQYFHGSPSLLIMSIFPEYKLLPWKFSVSPRNFWNKIENQKTFLDWAAQQLNIKQPSDWYTVSSQVIYRSINSINYYKDIIQIDGSVQLFKGGKSLSQILAEVYPEYNLNPFEFTKTNSKDWEELFLQGKRI
jgi:hypothetical protein